MSEANIVLKRFCAKQPSGCTEKVLLWNEVETTTSVNIGMIIKQPY